MNKINNSIGCSQLRYRNRDQMPSWLISTTLKCQRYAPDRVFGLLRKMIQSRERKIQKKVRYQCLGLTP